MDCFGGNPGCAQLFLHFVRAVLGLGKDHPFLDIQLVQQVRQQRLLLQAVDVVQLLLDLRGCAGDWCHGNLDGMMKQRLGQMHDLTRHGCREEQRLTLPARFLGQCCGDLLDGTDEAHVQHAVGFVQDEDAHLRQVDQSLLHEVNKAARRGDQNVNAAVQCLDLMELADAAEDDGVRKTSMPAIGRKTLSDLRRQFARRAENQHAWQGRPAPSLVDGLLQHAMQDGQREGRGFSCAGLGAAKHILARHDDWHGLGLNGRWCEVALFNEGLEQNFVQANFCKGGRRGG